MTVYSVSFATSPANAAGETTTPIASERINDTGANFVSSEDFSDKGDQVIDGKSGDRLSTRRTTSIPRTSFEWRASHDRASSQARSFRLDHPQALITKQAPLSETP
jgi:hypothetical protein